MNKTQVYDVTKGTLLCKDMLVTGFGEDSVLSADPNHELVIPHEDVYGDVAYSINAKESWTVTITLKQTSPWIRIFHEIAANREPFPLEYIDKNSAGVDIGSNHAMIIKAPGLEVGSEIKEQEVEIFVPNAQVG